MLLILWKVCSFNDINSSQIKILIKKSSYVKSHAWVCELFELDTHKKTKEVPRVIYGNIFLKHLNLSISFCTVPTTIWPIFSKFLIFCRLTLWAFRWVNQQQNMSKEENIGHIVQDKRAITSLLRMCKISTTCQAIYQI